MKKTVFTIMALVFAVASTMAQSVDDGIKALYYEKTKTAENILQQAVNKNSKDAQAIYWLGQAYIQDENVQQAQALYQKALNDGINDPWIWVGMGNIDLWNGDVNAAKQKFEQAITATTATRGRNKGKPNPQILDAIGRANAQGPSKMGDPQYAIEKLKQAKELDPQNPDIDINLGINYLKLGPNYGGQAVEAFRDATTLDPKYAAAYARIGRVYQSQDNTQSMNEWYGKAIAADPTYAPVYFNYFDYYRNRDVNAAKEFLDKYVANSDQDCKTQAYVADYLFRAGKYQESIAKIDSMANGDCKTFPGINLLYAYNYNRLGDSTKALQAMQTFFQSTPEAGRTPDQYVLAGRIFSSVSGNEDSAVSYLQKAMELDTVAKNKSRYIDSISAIYKRTNQPQKRLEWVKKSYELANPPTNRDVYDLADAAMNADSLVLADSMYAKYERDYPDQIYGYIGRVKVAQAMDTTGAQAVGPINDYINFLMKDTTKNGATIAYYHAILGGYYANVVKNLDSSLNEFNMAVRFDPSNQQYQQYQKLLQDALDKQNNQKNSPANKPKSGAKSSSGAKK
ncbi:MAG: tetratricopeptide repeat protein [Ilyomonas sp.]